MHLQEKAKPGIDQKKVLSAIQVGRGTFALKFAYFTTDTAPLMDKFIKQHGNVYELGGELMLSALKDQRAVAMHTTCYEKSTKVTFSSDNYVVFSIIIAASSMRR